MGACYTLPIFPDRQRDRRTRLKDFSIEDCIGAGGFGKVSVAIKTTGVDKKQTYAMKILKKQTILEKKHTELIFRERLFLSRLNHPFLANMHYAFQDDRRLYLVLDLCQGGDLHHQLGNLRKKCFSEDQTKFFVGSILIALNYLHRNNIVHRDIKPENLLLDENGHLKVTDLGISLEKDGGNCCGTSGTRPYMAPEIFLSGHEHSAGVDFYALGVTTHQLLTGHRPYKPTKDLLRKMVRISTMHPDSKLDLRTARAQLVGWQDRKLQNENYNINRRMEHLSKSARDFIRQCLLCNPHYRLGARGIHEVVTHPWFNNVNWKALRDRKARPPFVPVIPSRPADILGRYKEPTVEAPHIARWDQRHFRGYSFDAELQVIRPYWNAWDDDCEYSADYMKNHPTITAATSFKSKQDTSRSSHASIVSNESDIFSVESKVESIALRTAANRHPNDLRSSLTIHPQKTSLDDSYHRDSNHSDDRTSQEYYGNDLFSSCPGSSTGGSPARPRHSVFAFSPNHLPLSFNSDAEECSPTRQNSAGSPTRRFSLPEHSPSKSQIVRRASGTQHYSKETFLEVFGSTSAGGQSHSRIPTPTNRPVLQGHQPFIAVEHRKPNHPFKPGQSVVNMIPGTTDHSNASAVDVTSLNNRSAYGSGPPFEPDLQARRSYYLNHKSSSGPFLRSRGATKTISFRDDTTDPLPEQQGTSWKQN